MVDFKTFIVEALKGNIRVNKTLGTVEIYNEYGVHMVLRDLDADTLEAFKEYFPQY